jgi:hypothetical protein
VIRVTAVDLETGETGEQVIEPGNYCIIVADPCYLDSEQQHGNGTTVLTLKGRNPNLMQTVMVAPTPAVT